MAKHRGQRRRLPSGFRSVRDLLSALLGAAGILHETLLVQQERPTLLILFAALLGLPLVLRETDKGARTGDKADESGGDSDHGTR